jgi:hypothetical protein
MSGQSSRVSGVCGGRIQATTRSLNVFGIMVSICIVIADVFNKGLLSAILGGIVAGTVAPQQALPFADTAGRVFEATIQGTGSLNISYYWHVKLVKSF